MRATSSYAPRANASEKAGGVAALLYSKASGQPGGMVELLRLALLAIRDVGGAPFWLQVLVGKRHLRGMFANHGPHCTTDVSLTGKLSVRRPTCCSVCSWCDVNAAASCPEDAFFAISGKALRIAFSA